MPVTVATPEPGKVIAEVSTPKTSKINWTQIIAGAAMLGSYFGLHISPEETAAIVVVIGVGGNVVTWVLRTFFTNTKPSVG